MYINHRADGSPAPGREIDLNRRPAPAARRWFLVVALAMVAAVPFFPRLHSGDRDSAGRPPVTADLFAYNQDGKSIRMSDLAGKVWVAAGFYAECPRCAARNARELQTLARKFAREPGFHMVCISVAPAEDHVHKLAGYAKALGADSSKWWFVSGDPASIHRYLEDGLKHAPVREAMNPAEKAASGKYVHDMGITVVDRNMRIVGKRDITWAAAQGEALAKQWEQHLHGIIRSELAKPPPRS